MKNGLGGITGGEKWKLEQQLGSHWAGAERAIGGLGWSGGGG